MKTINIDVGDSFFHQIFPDPVPVQVKDNASIVDVLVGLDRHISTRDDFPGHFKLGARCLLQLLWDPVKDEIFPDVSIEARTPGKEMIPLRTKPYAELPDGSSVFLWPDAGC